MLWGLHKLPYPSRGRLWRGWNEESQFGKETTKAQSKAVLEQGT